MRYGSTELSFPSSSIGQCVVQFDTMAGNNSAPGEVCKSDETFIKACDEGDLTMMQLCLDNDGIDIDSQIGAVGWYPPGTGLIKASYSGQTDAVKLLLEGGANANVPNVEGETALMYASHNGDAEAVQMLLEDDANVNGQDWLDQTALMWACNDNSRGSIDVVKLLLRADYGVNVNDQDSNGRTALMNASMNGYVDVVKLLLENGADIDTQDGDGGWTALMYSSSIGDVDAVKLLLKEGADFTKKNLDGKTALMFAENENVKDIVALLQEAEEGKSFGEYDTTDTMGSNR